MSNEMLPVIQSGAQEVRTFGRGEQVYVGRNMGQLHGTSYESAASDYRLSKETRTTQRSWDSDPEFAGYAPKDKSIILRVVFSALTGMPESVKQALAEYEDNSHIFVVSDYYHEYGPAVQVLVLKDGRRAQLEKLQKELDG